MLTTGQLFLLIGVIGMLATSIGGVLVLSWIKKKQKEIQKSIWNEYK